MLLRYTDVGTFFTLLFSPRLLLALAFRRPREAVVDERLRDGIQVFILPHQDQGYSGRPLKQGCHEGKGSGGLLEYHGPLGLE